MVPLKGVHFDLLRVIDHKTKEKVNYLFFKLDNRTKITRFKKERTNKNSSTVMLLQPVDFQMLKTIDFLLINVSSNQHV